jgi:hypothetical protein
MARVNNAICEWRHDICSPALQKLNMSLNPDFFFGGEVPHNPPSPDELYYSCINRSAQQDKPWTWAKTVKKISGHITLQAVTIHIDKYGHTVMANSAGISSRGLYSDKHPILYIDLNLYRP